VLTFPGVFAPGGLLGAGLQSTAWLYILWHAGFPLFVIARAFITLLGGAELRRGELLHASAYLVLNFRDPAPPSPRGVLTYATPRRFPLRLITRNLSSGI
jgi:hypothetical protein